MVNSFRGGPAWKTWLKWHLLGAAEARETGLLGGGVVVSLLAAAPILESQTRGKTMVPLSRRAPNTQQCVHPAAQGVLMEGVR
jgi:hypothetical protein